MSENVPDQVEIVGLNGETRLPVSRWLEMNDSAKIQAITRNEVRFLKNGKAIPLREALRAITPRADGTSPSLGSHQQ